MLSVLFYNFQNQNHKLYKHKFFQHIEYVYKYLIYHIYTNANNIIKNGESLFVSSQSNKSLRANWLINKIMLAILEIAQIKDIVLGSRYIKRTSLKN